MSAVLLRLGIILLLYTAVCVMGYYVLDTLLDGMFLDYLYDLLNERVFWYINTHRTAATLFVYFTGFVIILFVMLLRSLSFINDISDALNTVLDEHVPPQDLSRDLEPIESKLRNIKLYMINEHMRVREAEQKKNDLVVYLAHDLKTPLSSVIGYLTLLHESPELPMEQRAKFSGIALDKAYRLEELINEFFEITRFNLQTIELERNNIAMSHMLEQMADEFYPILAEHELTISTEIEPDVRITGDADKLARVFDNLLRNAVNYSYPGTEIQVTLQDLGECCEISVLNHGDEIPPEKLERIFEKFFRLDSSRGTRRGGAGLGLAIARQIVKLHGGTLTARSSMEATVFCVTLPKAPKSS